jgi:hypothetical protein
MQDDRREQREGEIMKRMLIYSLLAALLGGCVVVPLGNGYDGNRGRDGQRFDEHDYDGGRYHQDGGFHDWGHGG